MEKILVLDFGGQYSRLIARRVRECRVYSEILPCHASLEKIKNGEYCGIILTGGPSSVYAEQALRCDPGIFELGIPVLGICYGAHLMAHLLGGQVGAAVSREYGAAKVHLETDNLLFQGLTADNSCWMSHNDLIQKLPEGFEASASTDVTENAAMADESRKLYAVQFHPEVEHTPDGQKMIKNFLWKICGCTGRWKMDSVIENSIRDIRSQAGDKKVLLALSGGVDSSVAAVLLHRAIGDQLHCVFVDHGLLRKGEAEQVYDIFSKQFQINLTMVNARNRFLSALKGVEDPELKRKIIGEEFIHVFEEEATKMEQMDYLAQGTIYPDVIESGAGSAEVIKSHHNVGGLPETIGFEGIIEPLRYLFKDEVRLMGEKLNLPRGLVWRQPFPGPGLAVRILGEITAEKIHTLQECDAIFCDELEKAGENASQYFAVLTNVKSVGVMGDSRTYDQMIALRAVVTSDFMTARWAPLSWELLQKVSSRIVSEVPQINRVVYDITSKPPSTIEWE